MHRLLGHYDDPNRSGNKNTIMHTLMYSCRDGSESKVSWQSSDRTLDDVAADSLELDSEGTHHITNLEIKNCIGKMTKG